jgi:hypothetical protein
MVEVDRYTLKYLIIAIEDSHRTMLSLSHDDGRDLYLQLQDYYGKIETVARPKSEGFIKKLLRRAIR